MAASTTKSSPADSPRQIPHYRYFSASRRPVLSRSVKITMSHGSSKEEVKQAVNRSLDEIFAKSLPLPVQLVQQRRSWGADTLTFSLIAKMGPLGLMSTPITGTVHVTDQELTIDVNLGLLERLIPADKAREVLTVRLKGLLK